MSTSNHRPTNDGDLVSYLQENQALLKTILKKLEECCPSEESKEKCNEIFNEHLKQIKSDFKERTLNRKES